MRGDIAFHDLCHVPRDFSGDPNAVLIIVQGLTRWSRCHHPAFQLPKRKCDIGQQIIIDDPQKTGAHRRLSTQGACATL